MDALAALPLGHNSVLMLERAPTNTEVLTDFASANEKTDFIDTLNDLILRRARKWVVANSQEQLERILPSLTPEEVKKRRESDRVEYRAPDGRSWLALPSSST
jgi:hypothetical protein